MDNSSTPAVGSRNGRRDQTAEKEMIRVDKEDEDMEEKGEGRGRPSSAEDLPSREEDGIEMEELCRDKRERDEVERGRRKRRREEKKNIWGIKGAEKNQRRDSCVYPSRSAGPKHNLT